MLYESFKTMNTLLEKKSVFNILICKNYLKFFLCVKSVTIF